MQLQLKIDQILSRDSAQTLKELDQRPVQTDVTMGAGGGPGVVKVAPSTTDLAIPLPVANGKYVFIETDYPITIKLNSTNAAAAIPLEPRATGTGPTRTVEMPGQICLVTKNVTSLFITNASVTDIATVLVSVAGD